MTYGSQVFAILGQDRIIWDEYCLIIVVCTQLYLQLLEGKLPIVTTY